MTVTCPPKALENEWEGKHTGEFSAIIPAQHSLTDVMTMEYFGRHAADLRVNDRITVISEDASIFAILVVRHTDAQLGRVKVRALLSKEWSGDSEFGAGYAADYRGDQGGWVLTYKGNDVEPGFASEDSAAIRSKALESERGPDPKPKPKAKPKPKPEIVPETEDA